MSSMKTDGKPPHYWRSLDELGDTPEFRRMVENEFPSRLPAFLSPVTRRQFLKVMGASMALLGMTGCRWPKEEIVPFAHRPEGVDPGVPKQYATTMEFAGYGIPALATSFDGRPIKTDGNPDHPMSLGGSDIHLQADLLSLYDPDRSKNPMRRVDGRRKAATLDDAGKFLAAHLESRREGGGEGVWLLVEPCSSPTLADLRARFSKRFPKARTASWLPFGRENETAGLELATGRRLVARPDLGAAEVIVCIDDDLLFAHPAAIAATRNFSRRRKAEDGTMNRLHVAESTLTVTGGMADHRLAVRAARAGKLVGGLETGTWSGPEKEWVETAAADLASHRGRCMVTAGPAQPPAVHALVFRLNEKLGNVGRTIHYHAAPAADEPLPALVGEMAAGRVDTLLILGGNPVFTAPAELDFAGALGKVAHSVHLSLYDDETSELCEWHLNAAHWLESWSDARALDGRPGVVQPLIQPLYEGRTAAEVLALATGDEATKGYDLVRRTFDVATKGESWWRKVLHDGFVDEPAAEVTPVSKGDVPLLSTGPEEGMEILFRPDPKVHDGRFANNAWLQELPDPATKLTWDNVALLSHRDAKSLGVSDGDHVEVTVGGRSARLPVLVAPGQAPHSVCLPAGYGRPRGGRVAKGVGVNVYPLRTAAAPYIAIGSVAKAAGHRKLARTENHHVIAPFAEREVEARSRHLIREGSLAEFRRNPQFAKEILETPPLTQLFPSPVSYDDYKWGMSIDLSACTGCSACVVACQAENNIPVVGRDEVINGREMQWIRVDRYYAGPKENPEVRQQPIPCMQCENAPCEQVCPVAATQHSREGLNDMVYNRCIGTRYCSNNCPYKVRRFNWFLNHKNETDIQKMVLNPEVTVRSRGVMEKCTYCVQRISRARIHARNEGRRIRDGEITPACAQACPAEAIVFGDLNDPVSRVRKLHDSARDYGILEELNTRPRTRYLAKLTNPARE